jgi:anti-sigma factor RsiW
MPKDPITIKEIEEYLAGELSPEHLAEFEKRLLEDEDARHELMQLKRIIEGIQGYAFKQQLKEIHKKNFPRESKEEL